MSTPSVVILTPVPLWRGPPFRPNTPDGGYIPGTAFRMSASGVKGEVPYVALPLDQWEALNVWLTDDATNKAALRRMVAPMECPRCAHTIRQGPGLECLDRTTRDPFHNGRCPACDGSGHVAVDGDSVVCNHCRGMSTT